MFTLVKLLLQGKLVYNLNNRLITVNMSIKDYVMMTKELFQEQLLGHNVRHFHVSPLHKICL